MGQEVFLWASAAENVSTGHDSTAARWREAHAWSVTASSRSADASISTVIAASRCHAREGGSHRASER
eukprot:2643689-Pleurochrysis_carterae.AAC.1